MEKKRFSLKMRESSQKEHTSLDFSFISVIIVLLPPGIYFSSTILPQIRSMFIEVTRTKSSISLERTDREKIYYSNRPNDKVVKVLMERTPSPMNQSVFVEYSWEILKSCCLFSSLSISPIYLFFI